MNTKNPCLNTPFRMIMTTVSAIMRFGGEYGLPVLLFFVAPLWVALTYLLLFIAWQAYSFLVLARIMRTDARELQYVKDRIASTVRRYKPKDTDGNDFANFLYKFIVSWDRKLNMTEDQRWNAAVTEEFQGYHEPKKM